MNEVFVYFYDGYASDGAVGLEKFENFSDAEEFILDRMERSEKPSLDNYTVIYGKELDVEVVEIASKIKIKD